jgi:predicted ATPase
VNVNTQATLHSNPGNPARHPFGELLAQYRARKPGLTQTRLAELAGYDQAVLVRMAQGKKDLTGPSGRERVVRLIETLADQGALTTLDEANGLLMAADMPPLFEKQPAEARLLARLVRASASHRVRRTNLPAPLSSFVGRVQEVSDVRRLLSEARLVTLTGAGGSGKTRLAQQAAADGLIAYPDGVWYAELAAIADAALIAEAVTRVFGLPAGDRPALDQLADFIRERHTLLVLDNCEHLIEGAAGFAIALLRECPRLSILATSREALNVEGEAAWRVPPMQPDEAARLFAERARLSRPSQPLSPSDATVAHICARLDGMPLAIELAAARLSAMRLNDVAARLDDRFNLLTRGRRGALPRHQTLRALIDWSYDLLDEDEKVIFCKLGVFVGGWELDLATMLIGADAEEKLTQLVNKSLVVMEEREGHTRYRYLETVREYALEKLAEAGELTAMRAQHAEAVAQLAEQAEMPLRGPHQKAWIARIARDQANVNAALAWSFGPGGDALVGCRIVSVLKIVWLTSVHALDAERWIRMANEAMTSTMPARVRAALISLRATHNFTGTSQDIAGEFEQALALYREANDPIGIADAIYNVAACRLDVDEHDNAAWAMLRQSIQLADEARDVIVANCARSSLAGWLQITFKFDEAEALLRESIQRCREQHDLANLTLMLRGLGHVHLERLRFAEALSLFEEAERIARELQSPIEEIFTTGHVAETHRFLGDLRRSVEINEQVLDFARSHVNVMWQALPVMLLAKALNDSGESDRAVSLVTEQIEAFHRKGVRNPDWFLTLFDALAVAHSGAGDYVRAARTRGCADMCLHAVKHRRWLHNDWEYAPYLTKARAALGDDAYDAAYAAGRAMTLEQVIDSALSETLSRG